MRGHRDHSGTSHLKDGQQHVVIPGVDRQVGLVGHPSGLSQIGVGLLQGCHPGDACQFGDEVGRHIYAGAAGDVVEHHRHADLGDGRHMAANTLGRWTVVIRGHHQHGVNADALGDLSQVHRVRRVIAAGPGHHGADAGALLGGRSEQGDALVVGKR